MTRAGLPPFVRGVAAVLPLGGAACVWGLLAVAPAGRAVTSASASASAAHHPPRDERERIRRARAGLRRSESPPRIALSGMSAHGNPTMGDKSPKSKGKLADQKQTKSNADSRQKQAAATAKQVPKKK